MQGCYETIEFCGYLIPIAQITLRSKDKDYTDITNRLFVTNKFGMSILK